jgi:hypothetical protein
MQVVISSEATRYWCRTKESTRARHAQNFACEELQDRRLTLINKSKHHGLM